MAPPPPLPERFRGRPTVDHALGREACDHCIAACPTAALSRTACKSHDTCNNNTHESLRVDLGKCLFCGACAESCPAHAIRHDRDYRLAVSRREDLIVGDEPLKLANALGAATRRLFGRSLRLRQVSAGGCNACEADTNVLGTVGWDLGRFGVQFVASPRHADGLLITGPVTQNMRLALEKTYQATPSPKIVIAVGACAISGGPYADHDQVCNGAAAVVPVDLFIPGCPPHPLTILDGMLRLIGRVV